LEENMPEKFLTVVIPVYNGEKHIFRALECLNNQTWKNFCVIIVNDASTDNTSNVIKKHMKNLDLVIYNLKRNHGVSYCRSLGIEKCKTPYITFMDHDDWIDVDTYERCFKNVKDDTDIAIFGLSYEYLDINVTENKYVYNEFFSLSGDYALKIYGHTIKDNFKITPIVNNKIYSHKFLESKKIVFDKDVHYQEDDIFTFKALMCAKNVVFVPNCKYHYLQNPSSVIHRVSEFSVNNFVKAYSNLKKFLDTNQIFNNYKSEFYLKFKSSLKGTIYRITHYGENQDVIRRLLVLLHDKIVKMINLEDFLKYCNLNCI